MRRMSASQPCKGCPSGRLSSRQVATTASRCLLKLATRYASTSSELMSAHCRSSTTSTVSRWAAVSLTAEVIVENSRPGDGDGAKSGST
jgi:hypothetical protein